ncbi:Tetratricopeptide repeat protein 38, partial [Stegodyphus mimosarum]
MRQFWRGVSEWRKEGLHLSSASDQACKLYDAALSQYVGWYDEPSLGGLSKTVEEMTAADPNFVMGKALSVGLDLLGTGRSVQLDEEFKADIKNLEIMAESQTNVLTPREKDHVKAITTWASGDLVEATVIWDEILQSHPTDILALKMAHDTYFYLGYQREMKDSVEKVLPHWSSDIPLYGHLFGMYAFGLVEIESYKKAESNAKKGLEINAKDAWSTHALAHVFEMEGRVDEGVSFLRNTLDDWKVCGLLACHNFWHWALYHIEKGESEAALDIFDTQVSERMKSGAMLDIVDSTSLLYRLELAGVNVGDRWKEVFDLCRPHFDDHILAFNDIHLLLSSVGSKNKDATNYLMSSLQDFISNGHGINHTITRDIGYSLCEAIVAYDEGRVEDCCDILYPLRYNIVQIGGSNAQRDMFNLLLIAAAMKSTCKHHQSVLRQLLSERTRFKSISQVPD